MEHVTILLLLDRGLQQRIGFYCTVFSAVVTSHQHDLVGC